MYWLREVHERMTYAPVHLSFFGFRYRKFRLRYITNSGGQIWIAIRFKSRFDVERKPRFRLSLFLVAESRKFRRKSVWCITCAHSCLRAYLINCVELGGRVRYYDILSPADDGFSAQVIFSTGARTLAAVTRGTRQPAGRLAGERALTESCIVRRR